MLSVQLRDADPLSSLGGFDSWWDEQRAGRAAPRLELLGVQPAPTFEYLPTAQLALTTQTAQSDPVQCGPMQFQTSGPPPPFVEYAAPKPARAEARVAPVQQKPPPQPAARQLLGAADDPALLGITRGEVVRVDLYLDLPAARNFVVVDDPVPGGLEPVNRNLATASVQREPELFRAFAMKGAEIFLRTASGGFSDVDVRACAMYNGVYSTMCNNALSPGNPNFFTDAGVGSGGSMIIGPRGEELAMARQEETMISTRIPMARYRELCKLGGSLPFTGLLDAVGLANPFKQGSLTDVCDAAARTLGLA